MQEGFGGLRFRNCELLGLVCVTVGWCETVTVLEKPTYLDPSLKLEHLKSQLSHTDLHILGWIRP